MANTFVTPTWTTKEVARRFLNNLKFANHVTRDYDDQYMQAGAKVGYTVNARLPQRFQVSEGQAMQLQPLQDATVPISLTHQKHIAFGYSTADATMLVQAVRERYVNPAADALANIVDFDGLATAYKEVANAVGTPGTTPSANLTYLQAVAKLAKMGAPTNDLIAMLDPTAMITLVNANQALFNPAAKISEQYASGQFAGEALGIGRWFQDANVATHVTGTYTASTPLVNGASQTGSSLITDGWASGATSLKKGDTFTIAGVFEINRLNYSSTGALQRFVVTADKSDTAGAMTIPIYPPIIATGPLATVSALPADDAVITVSGATSPAGGTLATTSSPQGLVYDPDAFALVMADLMRPSAGAEATTVRSRELGISIRMVTQYQIGTDQQPSRLDILYGWAVVRPEFAVRVQG